MIKNFDIINNALKRTPMEQTEKEYKTVYENILHS